MAEMGFELGFLTTKGLISSQRISPIELSPKQRMFFTLP